MGRIKTTLVKRISSDLMERHGQQFKTSFEDNKVLVAELADIPSKKMRNVVAGYVPRLKKQQLVNAL